MIQLAFQIFFYFNVKQQPFYVPLTTEDLDWMAYNKILSYEDSVMFLIASFQLVITCVAFSRSKPFRKPIYTNVPFFVSILLILIFDTILLFMPSNDVSKLLDVEPFIGRNGNEYYPYRLWLALGIAINSLMTLAVERFVVTVLAKRYELKAKL
mmetsp:Transcript_23976/g.32135  ORF Transcript_23976/g.32135 Transcript_23976/m.32135 type:complete len:154 (-) Transcript_23976:120-581(-)